MEAPATGAAPQTGELSDLAPRIAVAVTTTVVLGTMLVDGAYVLAEHQSPLRLGAALAAFVAIAVLQLSHSFPRLWPRLARRSRQTLLLQAVLSYAPIAVFGQAWLGMPGFLAASVLLVLPAAAAWPLLATAVGLTDVALLQLGAPWSIPLVSVSTLMVAMGVFGVSRMTTLIGEVRRARAEVARLAVMSERLRFARDLHDLLGESLSSITLRCELVYRMIGVRTEQAQQELTEILAASRQALADVRVVAREYREMSLAGEARAAVTLLGTAGIRSNLRVECGALPPEVDSVLAAVLREGLTNLLRHSKAEWCAIEAVREGERVTLRVVNDGSAQPVTAALTAVPARSAGTAPRAAGPCVDAAATGLASLRKRLATLDGTVTARTDEEGRFCLEAEVLLVARDAHGPHGGEAGADCPLAEPPDLPPAEQRPEPGDLAPRTAGLITLTVLLAYAVVDAAFVYGADLGAARYSVALLLVVAITGIQLARTFPARWSWAVRRPWLSLGLQAGLCYLPYLFLGPGWLGLPGFLFGSLLLLLPTRAAWTAAGVGLLLNAAVLLAGGSGPSDTGYLTVSAAMSAMVVFGLSRMKDMVEELHRTRAEQARLEVTGERLRFARDLHDLMGFSLSTITLKCELAYRLLTADPQRARVQLGEILDASRQALADVRVVARGYREMSLEEEAEAAAEVLGAAGIRATMRLDCGTLPTEVDSVLATVLREGLTNLLRHSKAEQCTVVGVRDGGSVSLVLANDGVDRENIAADRDGGSGLGNLCIRLASVCGTLETGVRDDGWYQLRAQVLLERRAASQAREDTRDRAAAAGA